MRNPRRGMALVIVMICSVLMAMMMTAFVRTQHANFSLSRRSDAGLRATQACLSGLDYARTRMQHTRDWGTSALGGQTTVVNEVELKISEGGSAPAHNLVRGQGEDGAFEVRWVNNLEGHLSQPAPAFSRRDLAVPASSALIVVEGTSSGLRRHLEALVRNDLFTSVPFTSGSNMGMSTSSEPGAEVNFTNLNPDLNSVKSRGVTSMPAAQFLHFGTHPGAGMLAGKEDVMLGADLHLNGSGQMISTNGTSMAAASNAARSAAENQIKASIQPARDQRAPTLSSSQLRKPEGGDHQLPAGQYVFTGPGRVAYYSSLSANPASDPPDKTYTGAIFNNGAQSGGSGEEAVVLSDFQFVPRGRVATDGNVALGSNKNWLVPQVSLGYDSDGAMTNGMSSWQVTGDLKIQGNVSGNGALVTKGTGSLDIQGRTQLSQSPDAGVALYSDNSITLQPVSPNTAARSDIFDRNDFHFMSMALANDQNYNGPIIHQPFSRDEWFNDSVAMQKDKVGTDDALHHGGLGTGSPVIRDRGIPINQYVDQILPNLGGYKDGKTPTGSRDLTQTEKDMVQQFITNCTTHEPHIANKGVTLGRHVRLKEYLSSCELQPGGNTDWLLFDDGAGSGVGRKSDEVQKILRNLTQSMFEEGQRTGQNNLGQIVSRIYDEWGDKDLADVGLRGLAYADKRFLSSTTRSFKLQGGVGTHQDYIYLQNLHKGDFHFQADSLERLLEMTRIPLIPINWAIE